MSRFDGNVSFPETLKLPLSFLTFFFPSKAFVTLPDGKDFAESAQKYRD